MALRALGGTSIPDDVVAVLRKGPKYSIERRIPGHELLSLNRRIAGKADPEDQERCLLDGVDSLNRNAPINGARHESTTKRVVKFFADQKLRIQREQREGGGVERAYCNKRAQGAGRWGGGIIDKEVTADLLSAPISSLDEENHRLQHDLDIVRSRLAKAAPGDRDVLGSNPDMVVFYTGLPTYAVLEAVYILVEPHVRHTLRNRLSKFQEMVVFLMRLRLNVPLQDLAYRFRIHQSTVTRTVERWLDAVYIRLSSLIKRPEREDLQRTMPMAFQETFGKKVAVIMDCFEVFVDRPSAVEPRSLTWATYKHANTVKYLIGIAPQGVITYISIGWGGRTSDKMLTESCGILSNLLPGDSVLADRGFLISDGGGMCGAKLEIPAFTKGKPQLTAYSVEATRRLANVRIHVALVIGLVRNKYSILKRTRPIEFLEPKVLNGIKVSALDKVVFVCAALTNLCDSVVPFD
ncbi:uncharacterized protein LOC142570768 [Dermacentor variabilis]|uniref:uncharacterized protein LOC142570768 n=1 Tax=Dermacentor variabilis TaxID=34621 RepID=UPI003F5B9ECE